LEVLLTLPVKRSQLVFGKFLAVMALVALSLLLTIFLPISVSFLGNLDWGPVIGGYVAALLMAAAYAAIGLFISSRTDNQIVSLILTAIVCGLLYLVGSRGVTDFAAGWPAELLRFVGTSSRFESIERGVIDLRDLVYYVSLSGIFLTLNIASLDWKRWSRGSGTRSYRTGQTITTWLVVLNLIAVNVWLYPMTGLRLDLTEQREYSLSSTTRDLLSSLTEPLTIRGYISEKTHPLLSPLSPQIKDMLREYEIAGRGQVEADVVDPVRDQDAEVEANQTYGIQPTPFQISGRYEASVVNAYFNILVRYGDQNMILGFQDLIETEAMRDGTINVRLRNLEYDLTRAIKKVVYGFQSVDSVLAAMSEPVKLTIFVTQGTLPSTLRSAPDTMTQVAQDLQAKSNGNFTWEMIDPDDPAAPLNREQLFATYKLRPIAVSLFSSDTYYLDMVLQVGDKWEILYPSGELNEVNVRTAIEAALKRSSTGFLKVVGLWTPSAEPVYDMFGQPQSPLQTWNFIQQQLRQDYTVRQVDLAAGSVPSDIDVLLLVAPQNLDDKARFAIDQYLMRGGSVIIAAGNYKLAYDGYSGNLSLEPITGGLSEMLAHYGITQSSSLVMDPQNEPFPVQVQRQVGGMTINEIQALDYPFFVDVRADGMDKAHPIVANLAAMTVNWASPLTVDEAKNAAREVSILLTSSDRSWQRTSADIQPDTEQYPQYGFPTEGTEMPQTLAVAVQGSFDSYFQGKESPLTQASESAESAEAEVVPAAAQTGGVIETSPDSSRLVVIGSAELFTDVVFQISSSLSADRYLNTVKFVQNAVDWSVEDLDLLTIRSRGSATRVLSPLSDEDQSFWEVLNYGLALLALIAIGFAWSVRRRKQRPMPLVAGSREEVA
jgi:ABC-2 type transport system permease protein